MLLGRLFIKLTLYKLVFWHGRCDGRAFQVTLSLDGMNETLKLQSIIRNEDEYVCNEEDEVALFCMTSSLFTFY